jgi:hypothetical protein
MTQTNDPPQATGAKPASKNISTIPIAAIKARGPMGELEMLIRARYPLLYVISWEEQRLIDEVAKIAELLGKKVFEWSVTTGLVPYGTSIQSQKHKDAATQDPLVAMDTM